MAELQLSPEQLRHRCDPSQFTFTTTAEVEPLDGTIGQARALDAIEFGLDIETRGYNIFATGPSGTGRRSTLQTHLEKYAAGRPTPGDRVYLFNFAEEERPISVLLPTGYGKRLARDMRRFVEDATQEIPRAFESDDYQRRLHDVTDEIAQRRAQSIDELRQYAQKQGLQLEVTPAGIITVPLIGGRPAGPQSGGR